jgi:hypothetical protein
MSVSKSFSRRDMLFGGMSALVVRSALGAALPRSVLNIAAPGGNHNLTVTRPTDSTFTAFVDNTFPALRDDRRFDPVMPSSILIRNDSDYGVRGVSIIWTIVTPAETLKYSQQFYYKTGTRRRNGLKSSITSQFNLIERGATRLFTPALSLGSGNYATASKPLKVLKRIDTRSLTIEKLGRATNVRIDLDAVLFEDWSIVGPDIGNMAKILRVQRNAEHDQAVAMIKFLRTNSSSADIIAKLKHDMTLEGVSDGKFSSSRPTMQTRPYVHQYWLARTRKSEALLKQFVHSDPESFASDLAVVRNIPKTTVRRIA